MARTTAGSFVSGAFGLLCGFFALGTLQLLGTVVRPPLDTTNVRWQGLLMAVSLVLLGITLLLGLTSRPPRAVPVIIGAGCVLVALSSAGAAGGQGQLIAGAYLTLLGLIAAFVLPLRVLVPLMVGGVVIYLGSLAYQRLLDSWFYGIGVAALVVLVAVVVGRLVDELRQQATRDQLTGVLNRHGLDETAVTAHDRDVRAHQQTTVVEIDLDEFKAYNDTQGHHAGDVLLSNLADAWRAELRHTDILARTGGDEFVLVLPATSTAEAGQLIERMQQAHPASWTFGLAEWLPGERMPDALRRADLAMYAHKPPGHRGVTGAGPQG